MIQVRYLILSIFFSLLVWVYSKLLANLGYESASPNRTNLTVESKNLSQLFEEITSSEEQENFELSQNGFKKVQEEEKTLDYQEGYQEGKNIETFPLSIPLAPEKKIKQKLSIRRVKQIVDTSPSKQGNIFLVLLSFRVCFCVSSRCG